MATIYVDGVPYQVDGSTNLLQACLQQGLDLPYFCWHPALGSVGACRQCAVTQYKDEEDQTGKVVMACMTPAKDGTRISMADPQSRDFRTSIAEWLMTNHPHDCPVCEEGGECHLQDVTVMTGHNYRRFRFNKRTFRNQDLGPFINHEMNRCITCYRCVRFYDDYAGGKDLGAFAQSNRVYFGRYQDGALESEFSGNLVEVCPTGVFTDKPLSRHYTRKWDLQTAPSICPHCSLGCNISPGERYGQLKRIQNRYHGDINGYFICDRGRFGYDYVNDPERLHQPLVRQARSDSPHPVDHEVLLPDLVRKIDGSRLIAIGSPRASVETNFALQQLVGQGNFFSGVSRNTQQMVERIRDCLTRGPVRSPSLRETEQADAILILGEDVTQTAPRLALSLRQAGRNLGFAMAEGQQVPHWQDSTVRTLTQDRRSPLISITPYPTRLDEVASTRLHCLPTDIARLGYAIANAIDGRVQLPEGLEAGELEQARAIAKTLSEAERPLVVSGTGSGDIAVIDAAANVAWALASAREYAEDPGLCYTLPAANSLGLSLLGGKPLEDALQAMAEGDCSVVVAENDLYRSAQPETLDQALAASQQLIVMDSLPSATSARADVVLPVGSFAENSGTLVNNEGRAQRFYRVFEPTAPVQESWRWAVGLARAMGRDKHLHWKNLDEVVSALERSRPQFSGVSRAAPPAGFTVECTKAARETHRYSGRTARDADQTVHEPRPPRDIDGPMTYTMEGHQKPGRTPPALIAYTWTPGWNSVQSLNKFQEEISGPLKGGNPGADLVEAARTADQVPVSVGSFFEHPPAPLEVPPGKFRAVPGWHIFGSEELSSRSGPIQERTPAPYLGVSRRVMEGQHLSDGDPVTLELAGQAVQLPVRAIDGLPGAAVVVPVGLVPFPGAGGDWCEVQWQRPRAGEDDSP